MVKIGCNHICIVCHAWKVENMCLWVHVDNMDIYCERLRLCTYILLCLGGRDCEHVQISCSECALITCELYTMRYRLVPPQTAHFRFDRKLKSHGFASTLHAFEPSAPRLQRPGSSLATNLIHCWNAIVSFFALDHAHCHPPAWARLSGNCNQLLKPLNNATFHTATTSLHGPFHLGVHCYARHKLHW